MVWTVVTKTRLSSGQRVGIGTYPRVAVPEKRKVGSSTLPLTTVSCDADGPLRGQMLTGGLAW